MVYLLIFRFLVYLDQKSARNIIRGEYFKGIEIATEFTSVAISPVAISSMAKLSTLVNQTIGDFYQLIKIFLEYDIILFYKKKNQNLRPGLDNWTIRHAVHLVRCRLKVPIWVQSNKKESLFEDYYIYSTHCNNLGVMMSYS